ncbi:MAG: hypothetical protein OEW35_04445 [Gammaproteobacteria bacterium]|nr:hypothetical protein [Gammaproteobacteria bacterium]MDH4254030.1 hypothetical protein [Gammaproteobacteria bacterium]MDH5310329.1 hypothetical protein [Gammaproteobacteria bacterium]
MDKRLTVLLVLASVLAGCAVQPGSPVRMATAASYCPSGSVLVCESLFEPGREIGPNQCGCADTLGRR